MYYCRLNTNFYITDYVGFIKKIMKLMQLVYPMFRKIEVKLTQEQELEQIPDRPSEFSPSLAPVTILYSIGALPRSGGG